MPLSLTPTQVADVVARLRSAGCVFAEAEADLLASAADSTDDLAAMVASRESGLPLETVVGWADFCGLRIAVEPGVFVPRHRTEFLVHEALSLATAGAVVVDLCCGSGAVGAAVLASVPDAEVHAADVDPAAVRCARRNLPPPRATVYGGDLFHPLPGHLRNGVDLVVCNAPYVPTEEIPLLPPEARDHEPRLALDGGTDGLDVHRRVAAEVGGWLRPGGALIIEVTPQQAIAMVRVLSAAGLASRIRESAHYSATVVIARRSG